MNFEIWLKVDRKTIWGKEKFKVSVDEDGEGIKKTVIIANEALDRLKVVLLKNDVTKAFFSIQPCEALQLFNVPIEEILPAGEISIPEFGCTLIASLEGFDLL